MEIKTPLGKIWNLHLLFEDTSPLGGIYWQFDVKCDSNVGPLVSDTDISAGTAKGNDKHLFLSSY